MMMGFCFGFWQTLKARLNVVFAVRQIVFENLKFSTEVVHDIFEYR